MCVRQNNGRCKTLPYIDSWAALAVNLELVGIHACLEGMFISMIASDDNTNGVILLKYRYRYPPIETVWGGILSACSAENAAPKSANNVFECLRRS